MKRYSNGPASFDPTNGVIDCSNFADFNPARVLAIVDTTARLTLFDIVTPGLGFINISGSVLTVEVETDGCLAGDNLLIIWDDGVSVSSATFAGTRGVDWSAAALVAQLPTVGATTFGGTLPWSAYVLLKTIGANDARNSIEVVNVGEEQLVAMRDDGLVTTNGHVPTNASLIILAPMGSTGGLSNWRSQTERGRISIFGITSGYLYSAWEN